MGSNLQDASDTEGRVIVLHDADACGRILEAVFRDQKERLTRFLKARLGSQAQADDVAQSAFLRLWRKRDVLHGENLVALLFVTAKNITIDLERHNSRTRRASAPIEEALDISSEYPDPERQASANKNLDVVIQMLNDLPEKCRMAFISYKFEEKSYSEISDIMGVTESMVRKYVLRATTYCVARFQELGGYE